MTNEQKQELQEQAQIYKCRADIFKKVVTLLEGFAKLEGEYRTMEGSRQTKDVNHMYKVAKAMEHSYRKTSEVAEKAAASDDPVSEALECLLEEIKAYEERKKEK